MLRALLKQLVRHCAQPESTDAARELSAANAHREHLEAVGESNTPADSRAQELPSEPVDPPPMLCRGLASAHLVTLLVPTVAHRVQFLRSTLQHLSLAMPGVRIVLSDHTGDGDRQAVPGAVAAHPSLKATVISHPDSMHFLQRLSALARVAETQYVVVHADDDYMLPSALDESVDFLNANPDHVCCQGRTFFLKLRAPRSCAPKVNRSMTRDELDAGSRIVNLCTNFTPTLYALTRRDAFIEANEATLNYTTNVVFWQYLSSVFLLRQGRSHVLDSLYYLRLDNPDGWRASLIRSGDKTHWPHLVVAPEFSQEMGDFRAGLIAALKGARVAEPERVADDCCIALVRRAFNPVASHEGTELTLLGRASSPATEEYGVVRYCGALSLAALTRIHGSRDAVGSVSRS
jgi:glycosyltransferase domain-containing protein